MLARTSSVSQSARELCVPRSTISRRLRRIEQLMGVKVAERSKHRLLLTGAERRLVDGATEALARLETVHEQARAIGGEVRGVLRVAMPAGRAARSSAGSSRSSTRSIRSSTSSSR
jgi:DNA-binding transcriptional LysR family regulator